MSKPLVGLTTYRSMSPYGYPQFSTSEAYNAALAQAGALPVMLPLGLPTETLDELVSRLDGLLFTGGGDVHPERYGSQPHPALDSVDSDRDHLEIRLIQSFVENDRPFMGICRGLQVINVALGGSLYEDLSDQRPGSLNHRGSPMTGRHFLAHTVQVEAGSRLGRILGETNLMVNSLHHQGLRQLAPGLAATAHAPDGLVEAFELPGKRFALAVQWHPENLQDQPPMRRLFQEFVDACRK